MKIREYTPKMIALVGALYLGGMSASYAATSTGMTKALNAPPDFVDFDKNQDGYVTLAEFIAMNKESQAFLDADSNRDGRLNKDEYIKARAIDQRLQASDYFSDAWISTKVKALLMKEDVLSGLGINVDTHDGQVQLSGWVKEPRQAHEAVRLASSVDGVRQVINDLVIKK